MPSAPPPPPPASREHLQRILDGARDFAVLALDPAGCITTWSAGAEALFGWSAPEVAGQPADLVFTPEDRAAGVPQREMDAADLKGRATDERWHARRDGSRFWASGVTTALREEEGGAFTGFVKVARDLTAQREVEERLRRSEQRHRVALEGARLAAFSRQVPTGTMLWSAEHKALFGLDPDAEVTFEQFLACLHPDDREPTRQAIKAAESNGTLYNHEYRVVIPAADGSGAPPTVRWLHAIGRGYQDERTGELVRFDGVALEITERKRAVTEAAERERRLEELTRELRFLNTLDEITRELLDPGEVMAVVARQLGEHLRVSRCAYAEVEADEDAFAIRHDYTAGCASSVGRYQLSRFGPRTAAALRGGRTLVIADVDAELPGGAGREMFAAIAIRAIVCCPLLKAGRLAAMMAVHQTGPRAWTTAEVELVEAVVQRSWAYIERARANRALAENEERFRALADNITQLAWTADGAGSIFWYNRRWFDYTGTTLEEVRGWGWQGVHHPDHVAPVTAKFRDHVARGEPWEDTFPLRGADGRYRWFLSRAVPIRDADGRVTRWFGTNTDVHEQREAEAAARHAQEEAEEANQLKDEFLATLSHELRTPLNAILGWAQMMRVDPEDVATRHTAVEIIERNTRAQVQLIEDLLDVSRITSGKLRLDVGAVDLEAVVRAALEATRPAAAGRGVRVDAVLDPHAGPVSGDPDRLQQVVWNLLSNAVKFTTKGGRVQVRLVRRASEALITVSDTGQGIEPEFLPHVFERFRQADSSSRRSHAGLGLGLALARHLVELHGGRIEAASEGPGRGATFTVTLPRAIMHGSARAEVLAADPDPDRPAPPTARPRDLEGLRVVAVDDDADARALLRAALGRAGALVTVAPDAARGLAAVQRGRPDVLISDIEMPGEDGYELMAKVRALAADEGGATPAVAVTAYVRAEDRRRALAAGFQRHLGKPVEPEELILVVASLVGRRPRRSDPGGS